jgi:glutamate racemase
MNNKVAFIDSGCGGAIFMLDFFNHGKSKIENFMKDKKSDIELIHIGDTKNVPYGLKSPTELSVIVSDLMNKAIDLGCKIIVVACNTAATVIDDDFCAQFNGIDILTIQHNSSKFVYNESKIVNRERHICILGTKRTIESKMYEHCIRSIHDNKSELFVHGYSPITWEQDIENGIKKSDIHKNVFDHLDKCRTIIGSDFRKITSVGLFCTHYPYFHDEICEYFSNYTDVGNDIHLVLQGRAFVDDVLSLLEKNLSSGSIENPNIVIKSYLTSDSMLTLGNIMDFITPNNNINIELI